MGYSNTVAWTTQPSSIYSDSNGAYETDLTFNWQFTTSAYRWGPIDKDEDSEYITASYTPYYLYIPSECQSGATTIHVEGEIDNGVQEGILISHGELSFPTREDFHQLLVNRP
jgi:hypothetical protein